MERERLTVRCACGWETKGTESEVVEATREHGERVHNMTASREQILAMAVPAADIGRATAPAMPKPTPESVARFKEIVPDDPRVSLRPMFGNLAAFANGYMFAGLYGDDVFVRLDDRGHASVIDQGGTSFEPMPGRPMRGYVVLPDAWSRDVAAGRRWAEKSLAHTLALPPRAAKTGATKRTSAG